jgi:hypothetical protein
MVRRTTIKRREAALVRAAVALRRAAISFAQCLHQPVADDDDSAGKTANRRLLRAAMAYAREARRTARN